MRGTCFAARPVKVVAVAGMLRISWCVLGAAGFRVFFFVFFFLERTRPVASMRRPCLIYLLVMRSFFVYKAEQPLITGVHTGCDYFFYLPVCLYVQHLWFLLIVRAVHGADFHKPGIYGSGRVWANTWDLVRRTPCRGGRGRRAAVDFVVCFGFVSFFSCFFSSNEHGLLQV